MSVTVNLHNPDRASAEHFDHFSSLTIGSPDGDYVSIFFCMENCRAIADAMAAAFQPVFADVEDAAAAVVAPECGL